MEWFIKCIKNYVNFKGRARRKEYWMFVLFSVIFLVAALVLGGILFQSEETAMIPYYIVALLLFLPSLAVCVRRLHDIGKSGWWYLMGFIPVVGYFILIYFFVKDGEKGTNKYGPNPKEIETIVND